jgi:hypothetical protein
MDAHLELYQNILSPETEYIWQPAALSYGDSSMQVYNGLSCSKSSLKMETDWPLYAGTVAIQDQLKFLQLFKIYFRGHEIDV